MEFVKSIGIKIRLLVEMRKGRTEKKNIYEKYDMIHSEEELSQGETEIFSSVAWLRC